MLPAVRLDRLDVFTTRKIQPTTWSTKASFTSVTWPQQSSARWQLHMVFRAYGPWARPPCFLPKAWPEGRYLQTSRRRSQCPACNKQYRESPHRERCRDFSKAQRSKRKEHIWGEAYIFRYMSSSKWRYGNRVRIMMADQEQERAAALQSARLF